MCKHKNLGHIEVIEAYHQTDYFDGEISFNNEYGGVIRNEVRCYDCKKHWIVNNSSPKFILSFHEKVKIDRENKM